MNKRQIIFYGWFIVATGLITQLFGYGGRYSFTVFFPSLLEDFQWPRDITAAMFSVHLLIYGFVAPVAGGLVDRIGPRRTMALGTILHALGLALSSRGNQPWHFYLSFGALSGAGLCLIGSVPFTTVLKNWFEKKRGLALSFLFVGQGGAHALYLAIALLINRVGWQKTFLIEAIAITVVILPLVSLIVRYHPRDKGLVPDGTALNMNPSSAKIAEAAQSTTKASVPVDWTLPNAVRRLRFWMICLTTFSVWGVSQHIMVAHHLAFAIDVGYSKIHASSILFLFGILYMCGCLTGFISDRIGREAIVTAAVIIGISGIFVLTLIKDTSHPWMLYYYATAMGFSIGMTAPSVAASATDIFQGPKVGATLGFIWFSFAIGAAIGPWLGGWIFETTGNYLYAFVVAMALFAVGCIAIWLAAPRKERAAAGK